MNEKENKLICLMLSFQVACLLQRCIKISIWMSLFSSAIKVWPQVCFLCTREAEQTWGGKKRTLITPTRKFCVCDTWFAFHPPLYLQRRVSSQVGGIYSACSVIKPEADEGQLLRMLQGRLLSDCWPNYKSYKIKQVSHAMFI